MEYTDEMFDFSLFDKPSVRAEVPDTDHLEIEVSALSLAVAVIGTQWS